MKTQSISILLFLLINFLGFTPYALADAPPSPTQLISKNVFALAQAFGKGKLTPFRTVRTHAPDPEKMIQDYVLAVHPQSGIRITVVSNSFAIDSGHIAGTLAGTRAIHARINQIFSGSTPDTQVFAQRAHAITEALVRSGAVLGYDGSGYSQCGKPQPHILVIDVASQTVWGVETEPCRLN